MDDAEPDPMDLVPGSDWGCLPPELLEIIGAKLTEGAHMHSAALVCKAWQQHIATGLTSMEVDMHTDPSAWRAKLAKLVTLVRHLRVVAIHVNAAISDDLLVNNLALVQQLAGVEELRLHLREGAELPPAAAAAIGAMRHLSSLTIAGGNMRRDAARQLLLGLAAGAAAAAASPTPPGGPPGAGAAAAEGGGAGAGGLRCLTLLPGVASGLGDEEMGLLAACSSLESLEFRAHRLSSAGLAALSAGLPRLCRLAISSLDSDSGYELACLERLSALAELDLALDSAPTGDASRRALCCVKPGRSLSLSFRWTDRAQGLLAEYGRHLANLTHLDVGACRVGSESLFEAVAQLTGLRELRMAVYSNADHAIPCHLSRLSALAALQRFHLEKRRAYFPEARRFGESSIAVPVTAEGLRALAGRWGRLRSLRLALSRKDYSTEGLAVLAGFSSLRELGIIVERFPQPTATATTMATAATTAATVVTSGATPQHQQDAEHGAGGSGSSGASGGGGGVGRLSRRSVELPPLLDLAWLPPGLQALELNNLVLELGTPAATGGAPAAAGPAAGLAGVAGTAQHVPAAVSGADGTYFEEQQEQAQAAGAGAALVRALPAPPPPPVPLSQLSSLDIEACVVRPSLLAEVARRCGPVLRTLRLVGVVGLSDAALGASLVQLSALRSLTVLAPGNRAVSQASIAALSFYRPHPLLRQLSWESDDLTSRGPDLASLAPLTSLRYLHLSCTDKTAELALEGGLRALQGALPYCHVDVVWTAGRHQAGGL